MKLPDDVTGALKPAAFLKWEYWPYYLAALAILLLLALLILIVLRRKGKIGGGKPGAQKTLTMVKPRPLPPSSLKRIWKTFLRQIPSRLRRSILVYHPFVVMGELGSGKSTLIDSYTDWKGQANKFYPSYTTDMRLQIYLGTKALVQEIPPALLNNTSKDAREALLRLWKPVFQKREPKVILVLNCLALTTEISENLRNQAQMMRGKINVLAKACGRPVKVCIALTHMDQMTGFVQFAEFVRKNGLASCIDPHCAGNLANLADILQPYEEQLSRALTSLSAAEYLNVLAFLKDAPEILRPLSAFIKVLLQHDSLSSLPEIAQLCLCHPEGGSVNFSNPFEYVLTVQEAHVPSPVRKHRFAAAALLAAGLVYLVGGYIYQRQFLVKAHEGLLLMDVAPPDEYSEQYHKIFSELSSGLRANAILQFFPTFFPAWEDQIRDHLVAEIRQYFLLPKLRLFATGEEDREKILYLAGLLYAARDNELGLLVRNRVADWENIMGLPAQLILDYVNNNSHVENIHMELTPGLTGHVITTFASADLPAWALFFHMIQRAQLEPLITPAYLKDLQRQATAFLAVADRVARYELTSEIVRQLKKIPALSTHIVWIEKNDEALSQDSMRSFLRLLTFRDVSYPSTDGMSLSQFVESLKVLSTVSANAPREDFRFSIRGEAFDFNPMDWINLLRRSRITLFMREFEEKNRRSGGMLFFGKDSDFPDVVMNVSNDGLLFFSGKGRVDGRLTRSAFEQRVKPVLADLTETFKTLPVNTEEKGRFSSFILKQAEAYADRYVAAYYQYYSQFHVQASSVGELRYVLKQIQSSTSPLQDLLLALRDNTALDVGESSYLRQFGQKLSSFAFIKRLMEEKDGTFPELNKYKAIIEQMLDDIESTQPYSAQNKADDTSGLKTLLSPLGRISLDIFRNSDSSYQIMAKSWLKSAAIDSEWQLPFLEPVQLAFFLGRSDVESCAEKVWSDLRDSCIVPLYNKFPFDQKAEAEISPEDLAAVAHPQGKFWKSFRDYLGPLCQETAGSWSVRVSSLGLFRLPPKMLSQVNSLSKLSSLLWDDKGAPKPIPLSIKPAPLPLWKEMGTVVVLSYLHCGKASVFAFNQQPLWQKLDIEWWNRISSAVGMESGTFRDTLKSYKEVTIPESYWSFFRLLQKGSPGDANVYRWQLESPAGKGATMDIEFTMRSDPWAVFRVLN